MKPFFVVTVEAEKHVFIELNHSLISALGLKSGQLFKQELGNDGTILLTRVILENDDVGAGLPTKTQTPARQTDGGAEI